MAIRFYADITDAGSALVLVQSLNEATPLRLDVTPLGTAFALCEGWKDTPSTLPLRLHAPSRVVQAVAEIMKAEPDQRAFPLFGIDELQSSRALPFFLRVRDMRQTWEASGRAAADFPQEYQVTDLRVVVHKMLTDTSVDWRTVMFVGSEEALLKAQEIQVKAAEAYDPGDEPPPLEGDPDPSD
uniref:Uncharacterized protein n=1 Tax=Haptolina ericina TaxID=156174 RepID=A0A7S3F0X7_9EUKA